MQTVENAWENLSFDHHFSQVDLGRIIQVKHRVFGWFEVRTIEKPLRWSRISKVYLTPIFCKKKRTQWLFRRGNLTFWNLARPPQKYAVQVANQSAMLNAALTNLWPLLNDPFWILLEVFWPCYFHLSPCKKCSLGTECFAIWAKHAHTCPCRWMARFWRRLFPPFRRLLGSEQENK